MCENTLVEENIGLVKKVVQSFSPQNYHEFEDFYSCGLFGLLKAIRTYDKSKGKLSTYAWTIIKREIINHIKSELFEQKKKYEWAKHRLGEAKESVNIDDYLPNLLDDEHSLIKMRKDGYTFKEISEEHNISPCGVYVKINEIQQKIKRSNKKYDADN